MTFSSVYFLPLVVGLLPFSLRGNAPALDGPLDLSAVFALSPCHAGAPPPGLSVRPFRPFPCLAFAPGWNRPFPLASFATVALPACTRYPCLSFRAGAEEGVAFFFTFEMRTARPRTSAPSRSKAAWAAPGVLKSAYPKPLPTPVFLKYGRKGEREGRWREGEVRSDWTPNRGSGEGRSGRDEEGAMGGLRTHLSWMTRTASRAP